jgi:hypothetical protein
MIDRARDRMLTPREAAGQMAQERLGRAQALRRRF